MLPVNPATSTTRVALSPPISGVRTGIPVKTMAGNPKAIACRAAACMLRPTKKRSNRNATRNGSTVPPAR